MSTIDGADDKTRKSHPIFSGVLAYFPDALLAVAELSRIANEKHNPGEPLHWSRGKSNDHADCLVRHQLDAGKMDKLVIRGVTYEVRHSAEVAWRALAQLQLEIEAAKSVPAVAVRLDAGAERRHKQRRHWDNPECTEIRRASVFSAFGRRSGDYAVDMPHDARQGVAERRKEVDTRAVAHLIADRRVFFSGRRRTDTKSWATLPPAKYLK